MDSASLQSRMLAVVEDEECWGDPMSGGSSPFDGCSASTSSLSSSSVGSKSSFGRFASSSSDFMDDATSPSDRPGPLYDVATLMAELPIKRGLSRNFQSFASLTAVTSVKDLAEPDLRMWRQRFSRRRESVLRDCKNKSYAVGLDRGNAPPISPNGRAISKPKKNYSYLARRNISGDGGGKGFFGASAAGLLPPVNDHHRKHGATAGGCLRWHQQHALLFT